MYNNDFDFIKISDSSAGEKVYFAREHPLRGAEMFPFPPINSKLISFSFFPPQVPKMNVISGCCAIAWAAWLAELGVLWIPEAPVVPVKRRMDDG